MKPSTDRPPLRLTTGDTWDTNGHQVIDNRCHPEAEPHKRRRSAAYMGQFRQRIPVLRAIRLKCGACMGGDGERVPQGEVARAIDECGSCMCPMWPFRYGRNPWRQPASADQREAGRRAVAKAHATKQTAKNLAPELPPRA
jgi:hypothetical protein